VVPYEADQPHSIRAFRSTDGGASWGAALEVAPVVDHTVPGDMRTEPLPSAEIDGAGRLYVAWQDCRFRPCSSNDIVISTSADGVNWSDARRVPVDPTSSAAEEFTPGIGVDTATSGAHAHIGLVYHRVASNSCAAADCSLTIGFVDSLDGGATWSKPVQLAGPMKPTWLAATSQGLMTGDYISTSFVGGLPHPVFAASPSAPANGLYNEAIFSASPPMAGPAPPDKPPPGPRKVTKLGVNPSSFRAAASGPSIRSASGTVVSYRSSAKGMTTFFVRRSVRRKGAVCGPPVNGRPRTCQRWVRRPGSFLHTDASGANSFVFTGRVGGHTLSPGRFQLVAEPRNTAGKVGARAFAKFTVASAKRQARSAVPAGHTAR
jgi:hypothetical protein